MFCTACGIKNPDNSKFCAQCGVKLTASGLPIAAEPVITEPVITDQTVGQTMEDVAPEMPRTEIPEAAESVHEVLPPQPSSQLQNDSPTLMQTPVSIPLNPVSADDAQERFVPGTPSLPDPIPTYGSVAESATKQKKKGRLVPILIGVIIALIGAMAAMYFTGVFDNIFGKKDEMTKEDISGYYVLESAETDGKALAHDELVRRGYALFVLIRRDDTAVFYNGTALIDCTCKNGELKPADGASMAYRIKKDTLTLTTAEGEFVFRKSDDTAPNLDELAQVLATPPEVGYFKLTFVYLLDVDDEFPAEEIGMEDSFLLLYADGTGILYADQLQDMCWENGVIYPVGSKSEAIEYTVTDREFILLAEDSQLQFTRSDDTPPDIDALRQSLEPKLPGYYLLIKLINNGTTIDISDIEASYKALGMQMPFLLVHEDGTAELYLGTTMIDMQWDETAFWSVAAPSQKIPYQLTADVLTIADDESEMVFERSDDTPPDTDALREQMDEPKNENPVEADLTGEYELYAFDMGTGIIESEGVTMTLNADGTGVYGGAGVELTVTWSKENLKVGTVVYTYEIDEDGMLVMEGSDGKFWFRRIPAVESRWNGDWYGFWIVNDCTGTMAGYNEQWWDLCARCTDNGDGTCTVIFWDEDMNSIDDPIGIVDFKILDNGELEAYDGWFYMDTADGELTTDNDLTGTEDMLTLCGTYSDNECSYTYSLYLRPWGTKWDDLSEDWLPYYYTQWYLPLIEAGETMPNVFDAS